MAENRGKEQRHQLNYDIGKRCREARIEAKLTQENLAEKVGCNPQFISDVERGIVGVSLLTLKEISDTLNVSTDFLIKGTNLSDNSQIITIGNRIIRLSEEEYSIMEQSIDTMLKAFEVHHSQKHP